MSFRSSFQAIYTALQSASRYQLLQCQPQQQKATMLRVPYPQRPVPERDRDLRQDPFSPVWAIPLVDWLRLCQSSPAPSSAPHLLFTAIDRATSRDVQPEEMFSVRLLFICCILYTEQLSQTYMYKLTVDRILIIGIILLKTFFVSCFSISAPSLHVQILGLSYCPLLSNMPFMVNFSYLVTGGGKR